MVLSAFTTSVPINVPVRQKMNEPAPGEVSDSDRDSKNDSDSGNRSVDSDSEL